MERKPVMCTQATFSDGAYLYASDHIYDSDHAFNLEENLCHLASLIEAPQGKNKDQKDK